MEGVVRVSKYVPRGAKKEEEPVAVSGRALLSGVVAALLTVLLGSVILSASVGTKLAGSTWEPLVLTIVQVAAYGAAGLVAGRRARAWGWFHGAAAAVVWVALAVVFQLIAFSDGPNFGAVLYQVLLAAAVGAISGMVGVNL